LAKMLENILELESVESLMQLVISPNTDFAAGVEALARGINPENGQAVSPGELFAMARSEGMELQLEKLMVKKAVETFYPLWQLNPQLLLFINLSELFMEYSMNDPYAFNLIRQYGIGRSNVVFDINQTSDGKMDLVSAFMEKYRSRGFFMCLDDVGLDYNNIDRVLYLNPDMIKVDVAAVRKMGNQHYQQNFIKCLRFISDLQGLLVVAKGLENEDDIRVSLENGAQFMQGYYISEPAKLSEDNINEVIGKYRSTMEAYFLNREDEVESNRMIIAKAIRMTKAIRSGIEGKTLLAIARIGEDIFAPCNFIENIWFVNRNGRQIGNTLINEERYSVRNAQLLQIYGEGSDFSGKELFRQLLDNNLEAWVTKPYRSVLTNNMCVGCSMYFKIGADKLVLCANVNLEELEKYIINTQKPSSL